MKKRIASLDQAPEEFKDFYEKTDDGDFALKFEIPEAFLDGVEKIRGKVSEFRDNNRGLVQKTKELEDNFNKLNTQFSGIDMKKYEKALEILDQFDVAEEKKLMEEGKLEEILAKRTGALKQSYEEKLTQKEKYLSELTSQANTLKEQLTIFQIDTQIKEAVNKAGKLQKGAEADVTARARKVWSVDPATGQAVARHPNGEVMYGQTGEPLTPDEYAKSLLSEASYLFEPSRGGAAGTTERVGASGKIVVDPTNREQMSKYRQEIKDGKVEFLRR